MWDDAPESATQNATKDKGLPASSLLRAAVSYPTSSSSSLSEEVDSSLDKLPAANV